MKQARFVLQRDPSVKVIMSYNKWVTPFWTQSRATAWSHFRSKILLLRSVPGTFQLDLSFSEHYWMHVMTDWRQGKLTVEIFNTEVSINIILPNFVAGFIIRQSLKIEDHNIMNGYVWHVFQKNLSMRLSMSCVCKYSYIENHSSKRQLQIWRWEHCSCLLPLFVPVVVELPPTTFLFPVVVE